MKIILRTILILLIASAVAGVFFLAVNSSSIASGPGEGGQPPAMAGTNGQNFQPMGHPEGGDRDGGSLVGGFGGVLVTLAKLTGITLIVLLVQQLVSRVGNRRLISTQP